MANQPKLISAGGVATPAIPFRFEESDLANMLTGAARVLNDLFTRQMVDVLDGKVDSPSMEPDASLTVLDEVINAFSSGQGLEAVKSDVDRLTMAQDDRMTLVTSLVTQHSLIRMARMMKARDRLERFMMAASERNDLTPSEALVFLKMIQTDMTELQQHIKPVSIKDAKGLMDKVDYSQKKGLSDTLAKYSNTSPQGREIIRKVLHGLFKKAENSGKPSSASGSRREVEVDLE